MFTTFGKLLSCDLFKATKHIKLAILRSLARLLYKYGYYSLSGGEKVPKLRKLIQV